MARESKVVNNRDYIIEQVRQGKYLSQIGTEIGLSAKAKSISNQLANDPDYIAAREDGLEARLNKREVELESCSPPDVPRARELLSHARWRAERECPARWGREPSVTINAGATVVDADLQTLAQAVLASMRVVE